MVPSMLLEVLSFVLIVSLWFCLNRLAELERHKEEDWKKKVPRLQKKDSNEENHDVRKRESESAKVAAPALGGGGGRLGTKKYIVDDTEVTLRPKPAGTGQAGSNKARSVSLIERKNQLQNATHRNKRFMQHAASIEKGED